MAIETSEEITTNENGFCVSSHPIVSVVSCDAQGLEAWSTVQAVVNAAIAKAYAGEQVIDWQTRDAKDECVIALDIDARSTTLSLLLSSSLLLRQLDWKEAADILYLNLNQVMQSELIPEDAQLWLENKVTASDFCEAIVEQITDESMFDIDADQYDELADKFKQEFEAGAEKTSELAQSAMEKAREQLTVAGKFTEEQGHKLKAFLENDLSRVAVEIKVGAKEKLNPSRLGTGALASMSKLLHKAGGALSHFADKADASLTCKSGEITSAGKLTCKDCGHAMNFKKTGRIPPCPKCHKTKFTKNY